MRIYLLAGTEDTEDDAVEYLYGMFSTKEAAKAEAIKIKDTTDKEYWIPPYFHVHSYELDNPYSHHIHYNIIKTDAP